MSNEKNSFDRLMDLFKGQPRLITANSFTVNQVLRENDRIVAPVNDLVLIEAECGSRTILQHDEIIKYIVVSQNRVLFNSIEYAIAFLIQDNIATKKRKVYNALFNSDTLAIHCCDAEFPIITVGNDPNFIGDPKNCTVIRYAPTKQENIFIRQQIKCDISSKLNFSIGEKGILASVVTHHQINTEASQ